MSRRPLFVLVGLVAFLALGSAGLWLLMRKTPPRPLESGDALVEAGAPAASQPGSAAIEAAADEQAPERKVVEKAPLQKKLPATALTPLEAELKSASWVEGKLRFPDGTPPDEKIVIEARGKKFSNDALHWTEVARDGSFRVAFAKGTRTGWLRVKARYAFLPEDHKIRLPSKPGAAIEPVELAPLLGGCIRGHLALPLGTASASAGLEGTQIQGWCMSAGVDGLRSIGGEVGADERFELGGVPAKVDWSLNIDPQAFKRVQKEAVKVEPGKIVDLEFALQAGARLAGQVVDEDGRPVPEANFSYQAPNDPSGYGWSNFHGKKSGTDGGFDLRGAPTAKGTLTVEHEGYLAEHMEFNSLAEGGTQSGLRIVLRRGNAIAGTVNWADGKPAGGVLVSLRFTPDEQKDEGFSFFGRNEQVTKSDSEGKFRFTGLGRGKGTLRAESKLPPGKADASAVEASAKEGAEPAADEKNPAAAEETPGEAKDKPAARAAKGRKWTAIAEDTLAGTQNVVLTLDAGYSLAGRVTDAAGQPVKEFLVRAEPVDKTRREWEPARGALTGRYSDPAGTFVLEGLHEGEWQIRAEAKNAPACAPQQVRVPNQGAPVVLVLAEAASLSGVVVDPRGQVLPHVRVRADPDHDEGSLFVFNANKRFSTSSDAEGKFKIEGIPAGTLDLRASCEEWAEPAPIRMELAPGQKLEGVQIVMRTPGRIVGLVLDMAGHTDAGRPISISGGPSGSWQQTTSDANGRFTFEKLGPGDYNLSTQAKQEEYAAASDDQTKVQRIWQDQQRNLAVKVDEGATVDVTLGGLPKNAIHLVGHVVCGGRPVPNAYLQAWRHRQDEGEAQNFHASAGDDGSFDLILGGSGDYSVNVSSGPFGSSTVQAFTIKVGSEAQQAHDFELPGSRISGRVVDTQGKAQAQVWLQLAGDSHARGDQTRAVSGTVVSDEEGRFAFEHVGPGTYEIVCGGSDMGWRPGPRTGRSTRSGIVVEAGKSVEGLEIVAQPACRVEGIVTGPDGAPVAGATVRAVDEQGKSVVGWNRETTDGAGRFSFESLAPGRVAFLAEKGSLTSGYSSWVNVQDRETSKADLVLANGTLLYVETSDANGAHVGADIQVVDARGLDVTDAGNWSPPEAGEPAGRRVGPLAPGKYVVVVMRKEKPDQSVDVSVGGEASKSLSVRCD